MQSFTFSYNVATFLVSINNLGWWIWLDLFSQNFVHFIIKLFTFPPSQHFCSMLVEKATELSILWFSRYGIGF